MTAPTGPALQRMLADAWRKAKRSEREAKAVLLAMNLRAARKERRS